MTKKCIVDVIDEVFDRAMLEFEQEDPTHEIELTEAKAPK